ncbi:PepSY domain-containing protein [Luxibacter massiliensis]|uniref:PepSY domain-containing protein n=1 Tax=Luxibacter massiliensis TaxID=2219695 RepID=UPI000F0530CD|nr:PepSY domain-containing protein [Luxibacter massiliensis]
MRKKSMIVLSAVCITMVLATGCQSPVSAQNSQQASKADNQNQTADTASQAGQGASSADAGGANTNAAITEEEAKKIALDKAGITEADTISLTVKQEFDDGRDLYKVELYTPQKDFEYEIGTADGRIYQEDIDMAEQVDGSKVQTSITPDAARQAVLEKVPGASDKNVRMKLDMDDGRYRYEGEIIFENMSYEFEMDAETGAMNEWSEESLLY